MIIKWWKSLDYWQQYLTLIFSLFIILNIIIITDSINIYIKTGHNYCSMGFGGSVSCEFWKGNSSSLELLIAIAFLPITLLLTLIFLILKIITLFKK